MNQLTLIKVGDRERPASPDDIADIKMLVRKFKDDKDLTIITHHAVSFQKISKYPDCATIFKVGNKDYPASEEDIKDLMKELEAAKAEERPIVTHHAVEVEYIKL